MKGKSIPCGFKFAEREHKNVSRAVCAPVGFGEVRVLVSSLFRADEQTGLGCGHVQQEQQGDFFHEGVQIQRVPLPVVVNMRQRGRKKKRRERLEDGLVNGVNSSGTSSAFQIRDALKEFAETRVNNGGSFTFQRLLLTASFSFAEARSV
jgi:hypothetical protein